MASGSERNPTTNSFLTEDILILIFTFLPLTSIYKFRILSKAWLSVLSDPYFITTWCRFNSTSKSLPWIHYYRGSLTNTSRLKSACPGSHSQFISRYDHGFSFWFLTNSEPIHGKEIYLMGSSNGLVLCYMYNQDCVRRYCVCNPLTRKYVLIPSPPSGCPCVVGFSCDYSSYNTSCCYKVVCITSSSYAHIFCSNLGEWKTFQVSCPTYIYLGYICYNAVTSNGVLYWINKEHSIIACNLNNLGTVGYQCSYITLPDFNSDEYQDRILGEAEGFICYARITRRQHTLSVWVLKEDKWHMLCNGIKLHDILLVMDFRKPSTSLRSYYHTARLVQIVGFNPVDHHVVLLGCWDYIWGFDIRTRRFQELCRPSLSTSNSIYDPLKQMPFVLKPMPTVLPPPSWTV